MPTPIVSRPSPVHVAEKGSRLSNLLRTTDHKTIGLMYLTTAFAWFFVGGFMAMLMRGVGFSVAAFVVMSVLPIALKRLLVGRWTAREFPLWGATYLRFWIVRILLRANPTLRTARRAISILTRQGTQLQAVISASRREISSECQQFLPKSWAGSMRMRSRSTPACSARWARASVRSSTSAMTSG